MERPIENHPTKVYLGDAVYAAIDLNHVITLTTENGISANNTIILEPEVLVALIFYGIEHAVIHPIFGAKSNG